MLSSPPSFTIKKNSGCFFILKRNLLFSLLFLFPLLFLPKQSLSQINGIVEYYDPTGSLVQFHIQPDMYAFQYENGMEFTAPLSSQVVDHCNYFPGTVRKQNVLKFCNSSTLGQRISLMGNLRANYHINFGSIVVTQDPTLDYSHNKWIKTNDLVLVRFLDPAITLSDVNAFCSRNNLEIRHRPFAGLPSTESWTWVLKINKDWEAGPKWDHSFHAAKSIYENEQGVIDAVEPDMHLYKPAGYCPTTELDEFQNNQGPAFQDYMWFIENTGGMVDGTNAGLAGADANLCQCWEMGYFGNGVKVAIIDQSGFYFEVTDLVNQLIEGYDAVSGLNFGSNYFLDPSSLHGNQTATVLAGNHNDGPFNPNSVGVAPGSTVFPILFDGTNSTLEIALQKTLTENVDVINMSFYKPVNTPNEHIVDRMLWKLSDIGRGGKGTVMVAATGNEDLDIARFPASHDAVIGVGASDPNDLRGSHSQLNPWSWVQGAPDFEGSNY